MRLMVRVMDVRALMNVSRSKSFNIITSVVTSTDGCSGYVPPLCDENSHVTTLDLNGVTGFLEKAWPYFDLEGDLDVIHHG